MAITTRDQLIDALGNNSTRIVIDKASLANAAAGQFFSLWTAAGQPGAGSAPTTAVIPTSATTGSFNFTNQTAPATSYGVYMDAICSVSATTLEIHDRLAHCAGLVMNLNTAQTTNLPIDLNTLGLAADRRGDSDYSDVQWWLEVYTQGGSTAANCTVNVRYNDNSTGNLTAFALGGTPRKGRLYPLNGFIPAAAAGKFIQGVESVTLSITTGTAGNIGVTATRPRMSMPLPLANFKQTFDWAQLGLPEIANDACLFGVVLCGTTSTGTIRGGGKIAHG